MFNPKPEKSARGRFVLRDTTAADFDGGGGTGDTHSIAFFVLTEAQRHRGTELVKSKPDA